MKTFTWYYREAQAQHQELGDYLTEGEAKEKVRELFGDPETMPHVALYRYIGEEFTCFGLVE